MRARQLHNFSNQMETILKFQAFLDSVLPTKKDFEHLKIAEEADAKKFPSVARFAATLKL